MSICEAKEEDFKLKSNRSGKDLHAEAAKLEGEDLTKKL